MNYIIYRNIKIQKTVVGEEKILNEREEEKKIPNLRSEVVCCKYTPPVGNFSFLNIS